MSQGGSSCNLHIQTVGLGANYRVSATVHKYFIYSCDRKLKVRIFTIQTSRLNTQESKMHKQESKTHEAPTEIPLAQHKAQLTQPRWTRIARAAQADESFRIPLRAFSSRGRHAAYKADKPYNANLQTNVS